MQKKVIWLLSLGLLVVTVLLAGQSGKTSGPNVVQSGPRYQIVMNPNVRADTFLLDNETGRIWQRTHYSQFMDEPDIWEIQRRIDTDDEMMKWLQTEVPKPK